MSKKYRKIDDLDGWEEDTRAVPNNYDELFEDLGPSKKEAAYLIVINGTRVGSMIKVQDGMTIGRSNQADFQTPDEGISRLHVKIEGAGDGSGLRALDLDSRNGMYVNGRRVANVVLKDGDKIKIGSTTILKFSYADKLDEFFQKQMYSAALRDPLTQIYNRRHFDEQLHVEFSYAMRHGIPLSLIMMDIDHFKVINDTYGHIIGDSVLVGLSGILITCIRMEDLFARYGGEEFVLLCRGTSSPISFSIANRIRSYMEQAVLIKEYPDIKVTMSAGVAGIPDLSLPSPEALLDAADKAMYQAKKMGRNRVCIYDPEMNNK